MYSRDKLRHKIFLDFVLPFILALRLGRRVVKFKTSSTQLRAELSDARAGEHSDLKLPIRPTLT